MNLEYLKSDLFCVAFLEVFASTRIFLLLLHYRMLLWDCDDRLYSYYIEVSVNMWDWDMIVDKSHEQCTSWQILSFEKRPVVFIRITGTQNTANEVSWQLAFDISAVKLSNYIYSQILFHYRFFIWFISNVPLK